MKFKKIQAVALGAACLLGAAALVEDFLFINLNPGDAMLRHPFWLSFAAYASSVALSIAGLRFHRYFLLGAGLICGMAFLLSLRAIELNAELAEVRDYYAGMEVRSLELEKFNDYPYCLRTSNLRLEINNGKGHPEYVAYRGISPVYFSDEAIEHAMLPLQHCAS